MRARTERPPTTLLLAVFVTSGFSALLYQTIWQRLLAFFSGADVHSVTITVAAFMAGLGFGSLAGGYVADRRTPRDCLRFFALSEAVIAIFAALSVTVIYDVLYLRMGRLIESPVLIGAILFLTLLGPTSLMGVSLPLLCRAFVFSPEEASRKISLLYAFNTLGAALGSLVTVWVLVRALGFSGSIRLGVLLNLACAALALLAAAFFRDDAPSPHSEPTPSERSPNGAPLRFSLWACAYLLSGFVALSLEILWFRILGVMLKSNAFTFGSLLSLFLLGLGLGSLSGTRWAERSPAPGRSFFFLQGLIGLYSGVALGLLVRGLPEVTLLESVWRYLGEYEGLEIGTALRAAQGLLFGHSRSHAAAESLASLLGMLYAAVPAWLLLPPTFLMGASFPFLQKAVQTDLRVLGRRVGWLQTANILGSTGGAVFCGLVLLEHVGTAWTLRFLILISSAFLAVALVPRRGPSRVRAARAVLVVGLALAAVGVSPSSQLLWGRLHGSVDPLLRQDEDGTGLSVLKKEPGRDGVIGVYVNGLGQSWLPFGGVHTLLGAIPVLVHPRPESVVVIGLGSGDTVFAAGGRPETRSLTCIEIVASQITSLRSLSGEDRMEGLDLLLDDPRLRLLPGDGRAFLMRTLDRYDVIEADALRPHNAYAGNLYSQEYFELLRSRLRLGGIAVTWAPTARIRATFRTVFPHVLAFRTILLGSQEPLHFDAASFWQRVEQPAIAGRFLAAGVPLADLLRKHLEVPPVALGSEVAQGHLNDLNHDLFPRDEYLVSSR